MSREKPAPNRGPLTGRDIAALDLAYARVMGTVVGSFVAKKPVELLDGEELFTWAFKQADAFVKLSKGSWAEQERSQRNSPTRS